MKKWIRGAAFAGIIAAVLMRVYHILAWKDTAGGYISSMQQLYNTEEELIDVVFVGSSHVFSGINPAILWEKDGVSAFDLSISGQDKDTAYHNLIELLKTQSPEVVSDI
ncbi:MAG: hypothetical protein LUE16_04865 [Lachnospiraceae bacterium]|nr:hypothetical protein [Lachnospiraceae bacterium]